MSKTYLLRMDFEFNNGDIVGIDARSNADEIDEALGFLGSDLADLVNVRLITMRPLNLHEQLDQLELDDERLDLSMAVRRVPFVDGRQKANAVEFIRDTLIRDLLGLAERLKGDLDLCGDEVDHDEVASKLNDVFIDLWYNYQGFMNEERGTEYYEAWLMRSGPHQRNN